MNSSWGGGIGSSGHRAWVLRASGRGKQELPNHAYNNSNYSNCSSRMERSSTTTSTVSLYFARGGLLAPGEIRVIRVFRVPAVPAFRGPATPIFPLGLKTCHNATARGMTLASGTAWTRLLMGRRTQCRNRRPSSAHARTRGKESHPRRRRASSCARRSITFARESTVPGRRSRRSPSACRRHVVRAFAFHEKARRRDGRPVASASGRVHRRVGRARCARR